MNEFAQLPTPMIATRTFSCRRSRPAPSTEVPFGSLTGCLHQLLADVQDPLADSDPGRAGQEHERPREPAPRGHPGPGGEDPHPPGGGADAHVAAEPESLRLG